MPASAHAEYPFDCCEADILASADQADQELRAIIESLSPDELLTLELELYKVTGEE